MILIDDCFPVGSPHRPGLDVFNKKVIIIHTMLCPHSFSVVMPYFKSRREQGIYHYCVGHNGEVHEMIPDGEVAFHLGGVVRYSELVDFFGFGEQYREEIFNHQMEIEFQRYKTRYDTSAPLVIKPEWNMNWYSVGIGVCTHSVGYHNSEFSEAALESLGSLLVDLKSSGWEYIATRKQLHDWQLLEVNMDVNELLFMPSLPENLDSLAKSVGLKTIKGDFLHEE